MKKIQFKNIVWQEGKYYVAQCLNIDVSSFGKTRREALTNLQEALELRLAGERLSRITTKVLRPEVVSLSLA
ncbi:MAG: type II toxin-antitoxin system HicB family antitoxin [bacterium]|nr:type II toxin-antitoxin system HicB family antitoxin [bacterium]